VKTLTFRNDALAEQVRYALAEIFAFCANAYEARESACEGSAEWHKRTGEVLAYARMTSLLSRLEQQHCGIQTREGQIVGDEEGMCTN